MGTFVSQMKMKPSTYTHYGGQENGSSNDNEIITRTAIEFDYGVNESNINDTFVRSVNTVGGENGILVFWRSNILILAVGDIIGEKRI